MDNLSTRITNGSSPVPPIPQVESLHTQLSSFPEYRAAQDINQFGLLAVIVGGCLGNLLALVAMVKLCHIPMYNYMAALTIVDSSVLLGPCLTQWLLTRHIDIRSFNTAMCRLTHFQSYWSFSLSAWILVAMTLDRFIAITFPLRSRLTSTPTRAKLILLSLAVITALINCHFFFTLQVVDGWTKVCIGYTRYEHFLQSVWPWIDATVYSFAPFFFLLVFNILIIKNHRHHVRVSVTLTGPSNPGPQGPSSSNRRLTILLITVSFSFILLTAPRMILTIVRKDVFDFKPKPHIIDLNILAQYTLTSSLTNLSLYTNHGINFFLYCLTGRKFRQQLIQTLDNIPKTFRQLCRKSTIVPWDNTTALSRYSTSNNSSDKNTHAVAESTQEHQL